MAKYRYISMGDRIDKIGELLAKGVYLYLQEQKEAVEKEKIPEKDISTDKDNPVL